MLFNIAPEKAVGVAGLDSTGTTLHKSVQVLAHVDDIVIIGRYEGAVKYTYVTLNSGQAEGAND
jgi:hypothetical protein